MKIGDRVLVNGTIDEIRGDILIVKNDGGYFGTLAREAFVPSVLGQEVAEEIRKRIKKSSVGPITARLMEEEERLNRKTAKLDVFLDERADEVSDEEYRLMRMQYFAMAIYDEILRMRINLHKGEADE